MLHDLQPQDPRNVFFLKESTSGAGAVTMSLIPTTFRRERGAYLCRINYRHHREKYSMSPDFVGARPGGID